MQALLAEPGTYYLPGAPPSKDAAAQEAWMQAHRDGPVVMIHYRHGSEPMQPATFGLGLVHNIVMAGLIALLLRMAAGSLPAYGGRVAFVVLAGVAANVAIHAAQPIWWPISTSYVIGQMLYGVIAWLIAGLILAWFVRPTAAD